MILNTQDIVDTLQVMRMQEDSTYQINNHIFRQQFDQEVVEVDGPPQNAPATNNTPTNAIWRSKMADWCFKIIDFCKFDRETGAICMSMLDRYVTTETGAKRLHDKNEYQLAAMACLYTAVKISEPEAFDPKAVADLSRGVYTEEQITETELSILQALQWRLNPPTALSFVRAFFQLLPGNEVPEEVSFAAFELARFQTELAVVDFDLCTLKPSTIAVAAIANAFEGLGALLKGVAIPETLQLMNIFCGLCQVAKDGEYVHSIQNTLCASILNASETGRLSSMFSGSLYTSSTQKKEMIESAPSTSPRSVHDNMECDR